MKRVTRFPETVGAAARMAYAHLRAAGVPAAPLLARVGLTRAQLVDHDSRISARAQVDFLQSAAEATSDDLLGFHLAQNGEFREVGLLYFVLASSGSFHEVLKRGARYSCLGNEGLLQEHVDAAEVGMRMRFSGLSRHRGRQQAEYWLTTLLRILRQLTGKRLVPSQVRVAHPRSRGVTEMRRYFGCEIDFDAPVDQVLFARKLRLEPVVNADPFLNKLLVKICEEALAHRHAGRGPIRTRVENTVTSLLPHGRVTVDEVARQLGLSQRTLARHLAAEGTSFSGLVDELRRDLAHHHLKEGGVSVSRIAWLLGYQGVSAFSHAHRRWTGKSPRAARDGVGQKKAR